MSLSVGAAELCTLGNEVSWRRKRLWGLTSLILFSASTCESAERPLAPSIFFFVSATVANDISGRVCINQRRLPTRLSYGKSVGVCPSSGGRRTEVIGVLERGMVYPLNFSMRALRKSIWDTVV